MQKCAKYISKLIITGQTLYDYEQDDDEDGGGGGIISIYIYT